MAGKILSAGIERWGNNGVYLAAAVPTIIFFIFVVFTAIWARENSEAVPASATSRSVKQALREAFSVDIGSDDISGKQSSSRAFIWIAFTFPVTW